MKKTTREPVEFRRGDILWIDCDPSVGAEPRKTRTCVVVSNDLANRHGATLTVIPTLAYTAERAQRPFLVDLRKPRSTRDRHTSPGPPAWSLEQTATPASSNLRARSAANS